MKINREHLIQNEESLIVGAIKSCIQHWPVYVVFFTIIGMSSLAYLKLSPVFYQANAMLIIKDEKKGNDESKLMESLNLTSSKKIIENEVQVLQSRAIIDKVVQKLYLNAPIYIGNRLNKTRAYLVSPLFIEVKVPDKITNGIKAIKFKFDKKSNLVSLNEHLAYPINQWVNTPYGIFRFIKNPKTTWTNESFYFELINNESAANRVVDQLKVTAANKLSSVINLQYKEGDPRLAEAVLNEVISIYNQMSLSEKRELARNTLQFIDTRLNVIGRQLDSIENSIKYFKGNSDAVDISTQGQLFLQNVSLNDQRLSDIDIKIDVVNEIEENISNKQHSLLIMPTTIGSIDPALTQLITTLNDYELQHDKLKNTTAENNPLMVSLKEQIFATKERIRENMKAYKASLEKSKNSYKQNNQKFNDLLASIPIKEQGLLEISRDKNIKSVIYAFLVQKREEAEIAYVSTITEHSMISNAHASSNPVSPNQLFVLGSAILLIIGFPIGFVSLRDRIGGSIRLRRDIETVTNLPIIGEVPHTEWKDQKLLQYGEQTNLYESFRKLRYALTNRGMGSRNKKLLITSGISGEGKSFIATNLALSFADVGKRVVLMDCDFKHANLSKSFNLSKAEGVTDFLSGIVAETDIINKFPEHKNLYFIPAGSIQQHTTALLENGSIGDLFDYLEDHFDLVIIDTAPLMNVADAYLLANYCDTTLFVVKHGYSPKNILEYMHSNDGFNSLSDTMILYNGVKGQIYFGSKNRISGSVTTKYAIGRGQVKLLN